MLTIEARADALRAAMLIASGKLQDWQAEALLDSLADMPPAPATATPSRPEVGYVEARRRRREKVQAVRRAGREREEVPLRS